VTPCGIRKHIEYLVNNLSFVNHHAVISDRRILESGNNGGTGRGVLEFSKGRRKNIGVLERNRCVSRMS